MTEFVKSIDATVEYVFAAVLFIKPIVDNAATPVNSVEPACLLLNVVKSLEAKYPFTDAVARVISIEGEVVELLTVIGLPVVAAAVAPVTDPVPVEIFTPFTLKLPVTFTSPLTETA